MRRLLAVLTLTALPMLAQEAAPRVAFFNLSQLVETSIKAKKIYTELEVTGKNLQEKLDQKAAEGQKVQQQLQSGAISDQGREQLQKQLRDIEFDFKKLQEDSQGELKKVQQRVMQELNKIVFPIIDVLSKEQKLQVVINGDQAGQMFIWADTEWLKAFTAEVAKRLDAAPEGGAAPKPAPAAPKTAPAKPAPAKPSK